MDADKRRKLIEISYEIRACGVCVHGMFPRAADWGDCTRHTYDHEKHNQSTRSLSINRMGVCPDFAPSPLKVAEANLHGFVEFVKPS